MPRPVFRIFGVLAVAAGFAVLVAAAQTPRATPARPGAPAGPALAVRKFGKTEYVRLSEAAARLGLRYATANRGREATLTGNGTRAELEMGSRETRINGLRVFLGDPLEDAAGQLYVSRVDFERCLTPLLRPSAGPPAPGVKTIVLDPGHGGRDSGTSSNEKIYALDVARRAKLQLEAAGFRVVLTRDKDVFVELAQRPAIANAARADLFVSIHFNAIARDTRTSGVEIFTFAPQYQRSTSAWSPTERDDTEDEASPVNRHDHWSVVLAQAIHRRFVHDLKTFDRGKKIAHWGVLRGLKCPGVLVECGFLTSTEEAKKIATPAYREKLAAAITAGIREYAALAGK